MQKTENIRNDKLTITTTASTISEAKIGAQRTFINIVNTSTGGQVITVAVDQEAQAGYGIVLNPGGTYTESRDSISYPTNAQFTAISSGAGGTIAIQERVISLGGGD